MLKHMADPLYAAPADRQYSEGPALYLRTVQDCKGKGKALCSAAGFDSERAAR